MKEIASETQKCPEMSLVVNYTLKGWPEYQKDVPESLKSFYMNRNCLSVVNGIVTYLDRIVIPKSLQNEILAKLHAGHSGITKCRQLAQLCVWWPSINYDIKRQCETCNFCEENSLKKA